MTPDPIKFIKQVRMPYGKHFNNKYGRVGRLGDKGTFQVKLQEPGHIMAAIVYTLRNPVHHAVMETPFAYPFSSANCYFRSVLGKDNSQYDSHQDVFIRRKLPRRASIEKDYRIDSDGFILRESVIQTHIIERMFSTPHSFAFHMMKRNSESVVEQQKAEGLTPLTLETIEKGLSSSKEGLEQIVERMRQNEISRFKRPRFNDFELCEYIDSEIVPSFRAESIYHIPFSTRSSIGNDLYRKFNLPINQLSRCLIL